MTIARRRLRPIDAIAPAPTTPDIAPPPSRVGAPLPGGYAPAPEMVTPVGRLRRCTYRRVDRVSALPGRAESTAYEVMCTYGGGEPLALGEISEARPVCEACPATGIFRPDED